MSNEIDFLLDEIRRECELGNIKGVIALSKRLEEITCSCVYEKTKTYKILVNQCDNCKK